MSQEESYKPHVGSSPQEGERSVDVSKEALSPQGRYQQMLRMAEAHFASLQDAPTEFKNDPVIVAGKTRERDESYTEAARYIAGLVGRPGVDTKSLRDAVAPEELKQILKRAGAGMEVLMMIGEGAEEALLAQNLRQAEIVRLEATINTANGNTRMVLEFSCRKIREAHDRLKKMEEKSIWNKLQAGAYTAGQKEYQESLMRIREAMKGFGLAEPTTEAPVTNL